MTSERAQEMARIVYKAMDDKKAEDIKLLDISEVTPVADYFIICSGANPSQIDAIIDNITEEMGKAGYSARRTEGGRNSGWILIDYTDVVVHVFSRDDRLFYDLERIWRDGKNVDIQEL